MEFMSDIMFDSNSYIDKNPFYVMGNRKENTLLHNNNDNSCPKYNEKKQLFLEFPTNFYLNKHENFYISK
jgi:hypothetical protein